MQPKPRRRTLAEAERCGSQPQTRYGLCESVSLTAKIDSKLTVQLTKEHRAITRDLERLKTGAGKLEAKYPSGEATDFIQLAESLDEHFKKEEQLLFPFLGRFLGSKICYKLNNEHAEIIEIARKLGLQIHPAEESVNHLEQLVRAHISIEENVLFWYFDVQQPTE
jgi:iron-sulfur cluster repair protein YtfE (RIC family)